MSNMSTNCAINIESTVTRSECRDIDFFPTSFAPHLVHNCLTPNGFLTRCNLKIYSSLEKILLKIGKFMSKALAPRPRIARISKISTQNDRDTVMSTTTV